MSYVDGIFERYWEEKAAAASPLLKSLAAREVQEARRGQAEDYKRLFCIEVEQLVELLEERERQIVWWRHPPPGNEPMAWRRMGRDLGLSHPIPQRLYRRAARRLDGEFRLRRLRPRPREVVVETEASSPNEP